jgi:RHS repeat-associated protein
MILRARRSRARAAERISARVAPRLELRPAERAARRKHASRDFCFRARLASSASSRKHADRLSESEQASPADASESELTGQEKEVEVGLQYFGKRFYAPLLQRWVSADPLAIHVPGDADLNVYAYVRVRGMALKATDPLGLECDVDESCDYSPNATQSAAQRRRQRAHRAKLTLHRDGPKDMSEAAALAGELVLQGEAYALAGSYRIPPATQRPRGRAQCQRRCFFGRSRPRRSGSDRG